MDFPMLYAKTSNGAVKTWKIEIEKSDDSTTINTIFGAQNSKPKTVSKTFTKGKNIGKKKGDHYELALSQAKSKFNKKKKEGYQDSLSKAKPELDKKKTRSKKKKEEEDDEEGDDDDEEEEKEDNASDGTYGKKSGPYFPMLAQDYNKKASLIKFPCFVQPKLDGVRAVLHKNRLWSRNGNEFWHLNHIKKELEKINMVLDGELYTDSVLFEELVGMVKRQKVTEEDLKKQIHIKYIVFDYISDNEPYNIRLENLTKLFSENTFEYVEHIPTEVCDSVDDVRPLHDKYAGMGYEGLILRNPGGRYKQKDRSGDLQKYKVFVDDEFEIIDYTQGTGKEVGCVIWVCKVKSGKQFNVRPEGVYEKRRKMLKNAKKCIGKFLTVRYQALTRDGIPRFPVGITIRDYE